jgi:hypothetical protein
MAINFVDLPYDIHCEIARIVDPRIGSDPSSFHADDPVLTPMAYSHCQPSQTLARLTLVCKRLYHIYAPFSTWRSLYIEDDNTARLCGRKLGPSPSLTRVLKYPDTGYYARELLIRFTKHSCSEPFVDAFEHGNMVDINLFLAKTPRLETVRCIGGRFDHDGDIEELVDRPHLPTRFFASLSPLASLRYLYLGNLDMTFQVSPPPPLHQVRILRYTPTPGPCILGDLLRFSTPSVHTLYVTDDIRAEYQFDEIECVLVDIEVRCHFSFYEERTYSVVSFS